MYNNRLPDNLFYLRYFPLFLTNKERNVFDTVYFIFAESAKEINLKAYEAVHAYAPLNKDFTYRYELWKKIDLTSGITGNYTNLHDIPNLQDKIWNNPIVYNSGEYYEIVSGNIIGSGVSGVLPLGTYWAPIAVLQEDFFYKTWGERLGLRYEPDSDNYLTKIRGVIYSYFSPPNILNIERIVNVVAGAAVALDSGIVVDTSGNKVTINYTGDRFSGQYVHTVNISGQLNVIVSTGQHVEPFQPLTNVVKVVDYVVDRDWTRNINRQEIEKYVENKDLPFEVIESALKYNLFLVYVNIWATDFYPVLYDLEYMQSFINRLTFAGINYVYHIGEDLSGNMMLSGSVEATIGTFDFTPDLDFNRTLLGV